jgi:hypothetical protein
MLTVDFRNSLILARFIKLTIIIIYNTQITKR